MLSVKYYWVTRDSLSICIPDLRSSVMMYSSSCSKAPELSYMTEKEACQKPGMLMNLKIMLDLQKPPLLPHYGQLSILQSS